MDCSDGAGSVAKARVAAAIKNAGAPAAFSPSHSLWQPLESIARSSVTPHAKGGRSVTTCDILPDEAAIAIREIAKRSLGCLTLAGSRSATCPA